jgi:DNA polymerase I-like protein with 3'-5' exonuclease and polymerase domains/uracil-DNA glycosylase
MIVGEAPGQTEENEGGPFRGASGFELTKMLNEAGVNRGDAYITNVCKYRPPGNNINLWIDTRKTQPSGFVRHPRLGGWLHPNVLEGVLELERDIAAIRPNLLVALGNTSLWATTGQLGITKWRGSIMPSRDIPGLEQPIKVLPTYHPASILRQWDQRFVAVHDLRKISKERLTSSLSSRPRHYIVRPGFELAVKVLTRILERLESGERIHLGTDIETAQRQITCIALAWSKSEGICLPFFSLSVDDRSYWSRDQEFVIVQLLRCILTHPGAYVIWQNGLYDCQYLARLWGILPNFSADTMLLQHTMFSTLDKNLAFISSLHAENYCYWKDDGKKYEPGKDPEEKHWSYNCEDSCYTLEDEASLQNALEKMAYKRTRYGTPQEIQHRMAKHVLRAMLRGVRWNSELAARMIYDLSEARLKRETFLNSVVGRNLNSNSPKQLQELFYTELGHKPIIDRKTKNPTCNADALEVLGQRDPILKPICTLINEIRQIRQALGFVGKPVDADGRIRCSYNVAGTETYRFSSSEDAFDFGTNLQNVTAGDEKNTRFPMPNMRKLFLPDEGKSWIDWDLPQADARIVAWDADDRELMAIFLDPKADLHNENARAIFGPKPSIEIDGKLVHPNRQDAKKGVHAVNYLVSAAELARHLGITTHEADQFIKRWFGAHPAIQRWHERIRGEIQTRRYVENVYGYRRYVFERFDDRLLKEIVAWVPQSTTAITINLGIDAACNCDTLTQAGVDFLLQVHDSADFQYPTGRTDLKELLRQKMTVEVPYETPLIMPPGSKESTESWGHCK